jgi:SAM-dependent methyltransferase
VQSVVNLDVNKQHYDHSYSDVDVSAIVAKVRNVERFLDDATVTDATWVALYQGDFRSRLRGADVLELGAGNGLNALVMAALGARVVAVDISEATPRIIADAAARLTLSGSITALAGDFADMHFPRDSFDFVVGKAFLHHLTHEVEDRYLRNTAAVLRATGEARFTEPAINSRMLDAMRWMVPVPGRPSRLNARAWAKYKAEDPHPDRDNSSRHYRVAGLKYFQEVRTIPLGGLHRLYRLLPQGEFNRVFRRAAFRAERLLPAPLQSKIAEGQLVLLRQPRRVGDVA